jgi:hypothetical protein
MYSATSRIIIPIRIRTVGKFWGPNPWKGAPSVEWSIEAYRMVQERYAALVEQDPSGKAANFVAPKGEALGIRSETDGSRYMLPGVLADLWRSKQVGDRELPRLIHAIEREMTSRDYLPLYGAGASATMQYWSSGILGALGLASVEVYLYFGATEAREYNPMRDAAPVFLFGGIVFLLMAAGYFLFFGMRRKRFQQRNAELAVRLRAMCTQKPDGQ